MPAKPRKVKAKITRTVQEIAIVLLNTDGEIEAVDEVLDELDYDDCEVEWIDTVLSVHG